MPNRRVFYNDNEMKYVSIAFRGPHDDLDGHLDHFVSEYPDVLDGPNLKENGVTQAKIFETEHFLEIILMDDMNETIGIRKIPYGMIMEISIESKKFVDIPMKRLSKSEKSRLK